MCSAMGLPAEASSARPDSPDQCWRSTCNRHTHSPPIPPLHTPSHPATHLVPEARVEEVQPLIAMALNGAVIIGIDTDEVLEKIHFPTGRVNEGVGIAVSLPNTDTDA